MSRTQQKNDLYESPSTLLQSLPRRPSIPAPRPPSSPSFPAAAADRNKYLRPGSTPSAPSSPANSRPCSNVKVDEPSATGTDVVSVAPGEPGMPCFKLIPTTVRCEGSREVVVTFPDNSEVCGPQSGAHVYVSVEGKEEIVPVTWLNNKALSFIAPSCYDDEEATVTVRVRGASLGDVTLCYKSDVTADVTQIYVRLLDAVCSHVLSTSASAAERGKLDELMSTAIFQDAGPELVSRHQIPVKAFEVLFDTNKSFIAGTKCPDVPTLLHLAAKHGLQDLCTKLIDLPDSDAACRLVNCDGRQPSNLALLNGHKQLATLLSTEQQSWNSNAGKVDDVVPVQKVTDDIKQTPSLSDAVPLTRPKPHKVVVEDSNHYLRMDRCSPPNAAVRGSNTSTASSGIDVREVDEVDDDLPAVGPVLPPRRKNSEPFINIGSPPNMCIHRTRTRRPSLPVVSFQQTPGSPSFMPPGQDACRPNSTGVTGLMCPPPANCSSNSSNYVLAGKRSPAGGYHPHPVPPPLAEEAGEAPPTTPAPGIPQWDSDTACRLFGEHQGQLPATRKLPPFPANNNNNNTPAVGSAAAAAAAAAGVRAMLKSNLPPQSHAMSARNRPVPPVPTT